MMNDAAYMLRCLELAKKGRYNTSPNPRVGCVIVSSDQQILGEGYHEVFGGPHAEVNAIRSVSSNQNLSNSTLYVNLEPCSHFGKTPPCANLIIEMKIGRVVIGMQDPNPKVMGNGIRLLRDAGVEVITGVEENACRDLNKRFVWFHEKGSPYIVLKWAQSLDGFIGIEGQRLPISGSLSNQIVHEWRAEEQAILIGKNTALHDNPSLTVRHVKGRNPIRIVLCRENSLPSNLEIFTDGNPTYILHLHDENMFEELSSFCREKQILSILVEGGRYTLQKMIDAGWWNEARIITNQQMKLNKGIHAPKLSNANHISRTIQGNDLIDIYQHYA